MKNNINDEVETALDLSYSVDDLMFRLEYLDFSDNKLSSTNFSNFFDRLDRYSYLKNEQDQIKVLTKVLDNGLDLNSIESQFSYGHLIIRSGTVGLIDFVLEKGFTFDSYTSNNWHSLELIQLNYFSFKTDKPRMLGIIKKQLNGGINLSKSDPKDLFSKLNRHNKNDGWKELFDLYMSDSYMTKYISDNYDIIIKNELYSLISVEAKDIFIF